MRELLLVVAASALLAAWWLWPLPLHAASALLYEGAETPGISADFHLVVWSLAWDVHALTTAPWRLFQANALYPAPLALAYSEHFLGNLPVFAPVYLVTRNPILATNAMIFASYPLCAAAMYALARRWTAAPAALVAGLAYAFTRYRHALPPYVHFLATFCLPLVILFAYEFLERGRRRDLALFAGALLLQLLASYYLAYATLVAVGATLVAGFASRRLRPDRRRAVALAAALLAVAAVFAAISWPYVELRERGLIPAYDDADAERPRTMGLVPYFAAIRVARWATDLGPPAILIALAACAFVPPLGRRRWPALLAAALVALGVLLAFGRGIHVAGRDFWSPYSLLAAWVPGFGTIRQPMRFIALAELGIALLAALGTERLLGRFRPRLAWALASAGIALWLASVAPRASLPVHEARIPDDQRAAYAWLAQHGEGGALLELPRPPDAAGRAWRMVASTLHWLPIVDGYSGYPPRTDQVLFGIANGLPDARALQELVDHANVRWLLVHRDELSPEKRAAWDAGAPRGVTEVAEWRDLRLFRIDVAPVNDRRSRLTDAKESLGGVPLEPIAAPCPGSLRVVAVAPEPLAPSGTATVSVEVRNDGARAWPARGVYPRHLVRLRRTLVSPAGAASSTANDPLPDDVLPGHSVTARIQQALPPFAGEYTLVLELVQVRDGPLSDCGVAPVRAPLRVPAAKPARH
ncbi:MAG TPA: hypothetical protein VFD92_07385 [Candidatus Binatia bacterium]|nr:hypothetical protein [Candidatus Binatia bacterium]